MFSNFQHNTVVSPSDLQNHLPKNSGIQQEQSCYKTQGDNNINIVIYYSIKIFIKHNNKNKELVLLSDRFLIFKSIFTRF